MNTKTFGRRAVSAPPVQTWRDVKPSQSVPGIAPAPVPAPPPSAVPKSVVAEKPVVASAPEMSVDEELRRWKEDRQKTLFFRLPWKQFSLIASLSFGAASFVLPDDVNGAVDYLLWGLSIISFAVWVSGFFNKTPPSGATR